MSHIEIIDAAIGMQAALADGSGTALALFDAMVELLTGSRQRQ